MVIRPTRSTPTTPTEILVGPLHMIRFHVMVALQHVRQTPDVRYTVQARGWGHPARDIAPMFDNPPDNIGLPYEFIY